MLGDQLVEIHAQLLEAATLLGLDLSGLLNRLVRHGLPDVLDEARAEHARLLRTRLTPEHLHVPGDDPLLRRVILAGRKADRDERLAAMEDEARRARRPDDLPADQIARVAAELDDKARWLYQLRHMLYHSAHHTFARSEQDDFRKSEIRVAGEIDALLAQWITLCEAPRSRDDSGDR